MTKEKINNYVNNRLLYVTVVIWKSLVAAYKSDDEETASKRKVIIPNRIATDITLISKRMSSRYNFNGYSQDWKEEMYQDGIESAITGIKNYNELIYNNVFGYISITCFRAFLQRIAKEKREMATKYKFYVENISDELSAENSRGVDEDFHQDIINKLSDYEKPKKLDKINEEKPGSSLDAFLA